MLKNVSVTCPFTNLFIVSLLEISFFGKFGSQSSDIPSVGNAENPLPDCPDSPNCIRITKQISQPVDILFKASVEILQAMNPVKMSVSEKEYKIETVFRILLFKDDMTLQLTEQNSSATYLHIRSASRVGKSDLGVNTRRVKTFVDKLQSRL